MQTHCELDPKEQTSLNFDYNKVFIQENVIENVDSKILAV